MSLAICDGSRLWHGDIMSPFPPSGNTGYVCNQNIHYLSVTTSYAVRTLWGPWKVPQRELVTTLWR